MNYSAETLSIICNEVKRQKAGPEHVAGLIDALDYAGGIQYMNNYTEIKEVDIRMMVQRITLSSGAPHYRQTPVTFQNMGYTLPWDQIPDRMAGLVGDFSTQNSDEDHLYLIKELLTIHPFTDGNGRLAFVLHNLFRRFQLDRTLTLMRILPLPEFDWDSKVSS